MRAENSVRFCQMSTDSRRNCFLPNIRMARSVNQSALVTASKLFLGLPDDAHRAVQRKQLIVAHILLSVFYSGWQQTDPVPITFRQTAGWLRPDVPAFLRHSWLYYRRPSG